MSVKNHISKNTKSESSLSSTTQKSDNSSSTNKNLADDLSSTSLPRTEKGTTQYAVNKYDNALGITNNTAEAKEKCIRRLQSALATPSKIPTSHRTVLAFSTESRMKNTTVIGPRRMNVMDPCPSVLPTTFRRMYERGDIPVTMQHDHRGNNLRWKVDLDKIDYHYYLPLFFDGLRETIHPYDFFSRNGVKDLLAQGGEKIMPVVPQLILPLKHALNTKNPKVICTALHVIQELVLSSPKVGQSLVPFYRQLLPTFNLFKHKNANIGDQIDYSQQRQDNLGDLIQETLEVLERHGGRDAYVNIKYMVPTYQSCAI